MENQHLTDELARAAKEKQAAWEAYLKMINSDTRYTLAEYREARERWENAEVRESLLRADAAPRDWCRRCFRTYADPDDASEPARECRSCGALVVEEEALRA